MLAFIDIIVNILLITFLLVGTWYEKIFSFLFIYAFTAFIYQSFVLICDTLLQLPAFGGLDSIDGESLYTAVTVIFLSMLLIIKIKKGYHFYFSLLNKLFLTTFSILVSVSEKNRQIAQNLIQSKYITTLKAYYTEIEKNEVELRKIRHDIKNHIQVLTGLIDSSDYEQAQNYLQQINDYALSKIVTVPNTGNLLLNAILLEKTYEFTDVIINFKGALKADISITDYDLTTIMGNLLDNALEYSRLHHSPDITLCVYQENSALLINLSNQIHGYINMKQFGKHSSKSERGHGYGISYSSMQIKFICSENGRCPISL